MINTISKNNNIYSWNSCASMESKMHIKTERLSFETLDSLNGFKTKLKSELSGFLKFKIKWDTVYVTHFYQFRFNIQINFEKEYPTIC